MKLNNSRYTRLSSPTYLDKLTRVVGLYLDRTRDIDPKKTQTGFYHLLDTRKDTQLLLGYLDLGYDIHGIHSSRLVNGTLVKYRELTPSNKKKKEIEDTLTVVTTGGQTVDTTALLTGDMHNIKYTEFPSIFLTAQQGKLLRLLCLSETSYSTLITTYSILTAHTHEQTRIR